jgi:hypothetical protein
LLRSFHLLIKQNDFCLSSTLTLRSEAGRAFVTLSVDLGHVLSELGLQQLRPRNGPARQRRREKCAADRQVKIATEEATLCAEEASAFTQNIFSS